MAETAVTPQENMTHKVEDVLRKAGYRTETSRGIDGDHHLIIANTDEVRFKIRVEAVWID